MSIRRRGRRSYQVRVSPFPAQTVPTREAAERLELDLKVRRISGAVSQERPTTLGQEIDGFLERLNATGGLRPRSVEFYEYKARVWKPLRSVRVPALRRVEVEDLVVERAGEHRGLPLTSCSSSSACCVRRGAGASGSTRRSWRSSR
jgi:hypothetical protein